VFAHFQLPNISEVARRTISMALVVGVAVLVAAASFGYVLVGLGACIGLGLGALNFRLIGNSVAKVAASDVENKRRPLAMNTLGRMGVITVVALGLTFLNRGLGFGVLGGLAVFQFILIIQTARSMAKSGPMVSVDDVISANVVDDDPPATLEAGDDARGGA
jgi:hypothetical protein